LIAIQKEHEVSEGYCRVCKSIEGIVEEQRSLVSVASFGEVTIDDVEQPCERHHYCAYPKTICGD
jgi:hypothetical protein